MTREWNRQSAADLGRGIAAGAICPVELVEYFLEAAQTHRFGPRIFARCMPGQAMDQAVAARARARADQRRGPLDGVPVAYKDNFDTAGVATEAGSALLKGRVTSVDALAVRRLTAAGLPPLGKVHMTELAFSGLGLNPVTATPPARHDPDCVPGGSSSGSGSALAYGLAPLALGTDTGGSVRVPAAWNDLVGLKTTAGRLSLEGVVPLAARFDTVGPLAHTVEDAALAFALLEGVTAPDLRGATLAGARFMVLETGVLENLEDAPAKGFEHALSRLAAAGARIERGALPDVAEAMDLSGILFAPECYGTWATQIEARPEVMFPPVLARFRGGKDAAASDYIAAWQRLDALRAAYHQATAGFDAVLVPSVAIMPPRIADLTADHALFVERNLMALRNTRVGNLMGGCALTLPTGLPATGLSMMAPPMAEERLLRLGVAVEAALAG